MKKFEYEIKLNDDGRPYVHLEDNNSFNGEDKFVCVEITKYIIFQLIESENEFPEEFMKDLGIAGNMIDGISNKFAELIKGQNDVISDVDDILNPEKPEE